LLATVKDLGSRDETQDHNWESSKSVKNGPENDARYAAKAMAGITV
jgi:hypothetical protein